MRPAPVRRPSTRPSCGLRTVCCIHQARSGLRVWLRAGERTPADDRAAVTRWTDLSGNGNDAIWIEGNAFGELPPVFVPSNPGASNKPTIRFDGQNALQLDLSWLAGADYTVLVVNGRDRS